MGKQKLSAKGAKDKAIRDLACANSTDRKHGIQWLVGKDFDHNTGRFTSTKHNRGGTQSKGKKDGTKAEKKQSKK